MGTRTPYSDEFKQEAIKLVTEQGLRRSQVARDLGVDPQTLRRWLHAAATPDAPSAPTADALARLRRENEQLRIERDILKKVVGIFSRMPHCASAISVSPPTRRRTRSARCVACLGSPAVAIMPGNAVRSVRGPSRIGR